jgi:hypothetical protein
VTSKDGGLLFTDNRAAISGADAGSSAPMGGRTRWWFGDVFLPDPKTPAKPYVGRVSSCLPSSAHRAGRSSATPCRPGRNTRNSPTYGGRVITITEVDSRRYWLHPMKVTLANA